MPITSVSSSNVMMSLIIKRRQSITEQFAQEKRRQGVTEEAAPEKPSQGATEESSHYWPGGENHCFKFCSRSAILTAWHEGNTFARIPEEPRCEAACVLCQRKVFGGPHPFRRRLATRLDTTARCAAGWRPGRTRVFASCEEGDLAGPGCPLQARMATMLDQNARFVRGW